MNRVRPLVLLVIAFGLLVCSLATSALAEEAPPNFIVILTDDQGWGTTSIDYDPRHPRSKSDFFQTPNIERLARAGMRFTRAYSAHPNCSPSRAALLTGRSPAALHMTDIVGRNAGPLYEGNRVTPPAHINRLPDREQTIPERLKAHEPGYRAAHFGKWHLRGGGPGNHGFDAGDGATGNREGSLSENLPDDPKRVFGITRRATDWMARQARGGRPFYLQVSHYATHLGYQYRPETFEKFKAMEPGERHTNQRFAAMLWDMDVAIGRLLDAVDRLGLGENTYIIYTADNGTYPTEDPSNINGPLRGHKASLWEGGVRVPFIVAGPDIEADSISRTPVVGYDILPTICELAGSPPTELPGEVEGGSLVPILRGRDERVQRQHGGLFFHWPHYQHAKRSVPHSTVLRDGWKLHYWWETGTVSLYQLDEDPKESKQLDEGRRNRARRMRLRLLRYLNEIDARLPAGNAAFDAEADPAGWRSIVSNADPPPAELPVRSRFELSASDELSGLIAPQIANRPITIEAEVTAAGDGVIVAQGGRNLGYSLYIQDGTVSLATKIHGEMSAIAAAAELPGGRHTIEANIERGGTLTLSVDGERVASGRSPGLIPSQPIDQLQVGRDGRTQVGPYEGSNPFKGDIHRLLIRLPDAAKDGS